ncbi:MFS transporter [Micromonospora sp. CA-244673]|uniref:MFS transporter n=1 Tax=Micromonospora sp. CA-244673 TaxID=3239958 RepID=UPI003D8A9E7E
MISKLLRVVRLGLPEDEIFRRLAAATLLSSFGQGLFLACSAIFYVRIVGLTAAEVGAGLAAGTLFGMLGSIPIARLSDRRDPRSIILALALGESVLLVSLLAVRSMVGFAAVVCMLLLATRSNSAVRNALIARAVAPERRVHLKAYQRVVYNVSFSAGTAVAAIPLALGTRPAFAAALLGSGVAAASAGVVTRKLPGAQLCGPPVERGQSAIRNFQYLRVAILCGLLSARMSILTVAVPLWVTGHTALAPWTASALIFLNTILAIALQVPASRGADDVPGSRRMVRLGAVVMLPACLLFALVGRVGTVAALLAALAAIVLFTLGEIWTSAGAWGLSFGLADPSAPGDYQAVFALGVGVGAVVGPVLATKVAVDMGILGWGLVGLFFVVAGVWAHRAVPSVRVPEVSTAP